MSSDGNPSDASFGSWVKAERERRKMTLASTARRAGISHVALYKIENGQIKNPRAETRAALAKALEETIPTDVTLEIAQQYEIPGLGELQDFDPHDKAQWPKLAGIYVLYDISQRPIYVGQSSNVYSRLRDHEQKFWYKAPIVDTASFIPVADKDLRVRVETILIKFLRTNAVINFVTRD